MLIVLAADQISKTAISEFWGSKTEIVPFLWIADTRNHNESAISQEWLPAWAELLVAFPLATLLLFLMVRNIRTVPAVIMKGVFAGGALGNATCRAVRLSGDGGHVIGGGGVVDWLGGGDLFYTNLADFAIIAGLSALVSWKLASAARGIQPLAGKRNFGCTAKLLGDAPIRQNFRVNYAAEMSRRHPWRHRPYVVVSEIQYHPAARCVAV